MIHRVLWVSVLGSFVLPGAHAQTAAPPPDKAAMERALQQADGPKRRILEAARLKSGVAPTPSPAPPPPVAAAPKPRADGGDKPAEKATEKATERAAERPADREAVTVVTLPAGVEPLALPASANVGSVATIAPMESAPRAATLADLPPPAASPAPVPASADGLPPPRLVAMVEPELPARLFRRGSGRTEVLVDLVIDPDGTVRSATVRSSSNSDVENAVVQAVRQWRYEPQPSPRSHLVRLVASPP